MSKKLINTIILLSLFLLYRGSIWALNGRSPFAGKQLRPTKPVPKVSPEERVEESIGISCRLQINDVSPREIYTSSRRITVSYNLTCTSPLDVEEIPVKVALFLNNRVKKVQELENLPKGRTMRLFISIPPPTEAGEYQILLKVVKFHINNLQRARGKDVLATAHQRIEVKQPLADLIIENFTVSEPIITPVEDRFGEYLTVKFPVSIRVKNIGPAPAGRFDVVVNEITKVERFEELLRQRVSGLRSGQSITLTGTTQRVGLIHFPHGLKLQAKVDAPLVREFASKQGQVRELNEENNLSPVVEKRLENLLDIRAPISTYRGSHIEISGNFGSSLGNKKVAIESGGSIVGYAELIRFTSRKLTVKIPKDDSIRPETNYKIFIVDANGNKISNYQTIHIIKPLRITEIKSRVGFTYSPTGDIPPNILVNGYPLVVNYDWRRFGVLKWAFVSSLPAREQDFKPLSELPKVVNLPAGRYYFFLRDFTEPFYGSGESEGVAFQEVIVKDVEQRSIDWRTFQGFTGIQLNIYSRIHCDEGSFFMVEIKDGGEYEHKEIIRKECTDFIIKGPVGIRDIRHKIRIISGVNDGKWLISNGKLVIPITFTTNFISCNPEIKRYSRGLRGGWYDAGAYDINLTKFEMKIKFGIGSPVHPLNRYNVIHDVELDIDLEADVSNVPDWMEVWGIVEGRIKKNLETQLLPFFSSSSLKENLYNGLVEQIRNTEDFEGVIILTVYTSGENFVFKYITLE